MRPARRLPVYESMLRRGVIVRPVGNYGLPNHLRITIGTREQNERMLAALETSHVTLTSQATLQLSP